MVLMKTVVEDNEILQRPCNTKCIFPAMLDGNNCKTDLEDSANACNIVFLINGDKNRF